MAMHGVGSLVRSVVVCLRRHPVLPATGLAVVAFPLALALAGVARAQQLDWTRARLLEPRGASAAAYDEARQRLVLFGGHTANGISQDTWEWDGRTWAPRSPAAFPSPRRWHAVAYDTARQRVVLFGGQDYVGALGDTWEWDGVTWTLRQPARSPSPRGCHAMAYDAARGRVVLCGGGATPDTWEWDGTTWTERTPDAGPNPAEGAMAYDPVRQVVVLFGNSADTWEWNGATWSPRTTAAAPSARTRHALAYDGARGVVVLFGGVTYVTNREVALDDTWEWDGRSWTQQ